MSKFQEMIDATCDDLEKFVGVNRMSHRQFGEWVFDIQQEQISQQSQLIDKCLEVIEHYNYPDVDMSGLTIVKSGCVANDFLKSEILKELESDR